MTTPSDASQSDVASFEGHLMLQEEAEGLAVTLRVTETRVTLFSGRSELGAWPADGVAIVAGEDDHYEFIAEGDHLVFVPSEPGPFSSHALISALAPLPPPKRFRIRRSKPEPVADATPPKFAVEAPKRSAKRRKKEEEPAVSEPGPREPAAEQAAPKFAAPKPKRRIKIPRAKRKPVSVEPEPFADAPVTPSSLEHPVARSVEAASIEGVPVREDPLVSRRLRAWLYTIDQARQYDLFGLDRVPVTRKMRDEDAHRHTWDHRVSAGFASQHICTICGKIRITSR